LIDAAANGTVRFRRTPGIPERRPVGNKIEWLPADRPHGHQHRYNEKNAAYESALILTT
jgi:hypothetical protein